MAIVFDTQAELEAFCEAFELKNAERERPVRNARKRSSEKHSTENHSLWKRSERTASRTIFLQELEIPAVEIQASPESQVSSALSEAAEAEPVSNPAFSGEHMDVFASAS
ncbi:MAG: hypothetical protein K0Q50_1618 [Vampirovibrio sp.]|nr:hypothetical protein [Vampirovibrio sp.]